METGRASLGAWSNQELQTLSPMERDTFSSLLKAIAAGQGWRFSLLSMAFLDMLGSPTLAVFSFLGSIRVPSFICTGSLATMHLFYTLLLVLRIMENILPDMEPAVERSLSDLPPGYIRREFRKQHLRREHFIGKVIGASVLLLSGVLLSSAVLKLLYWNSWYPESKEQRLELASKISLCSGCGCALYAPQLLLQVTAAQHLRCRAFWDSAAVSALCCLAMLVLLVVSTCQERWEWRWQAEPVVAILLFFTMIVSGLWQTCRELGDVERRADMEVALEEAAEAKDRESRQRFAPSF